MADILSYTEAKGTAQGAETPVAEDKLMVVAEVYLTPEVAAEMVATLGANGSSERATRDPLSRAILEAIQASGIL